MMSEYQEYRKIEAKEMKKLLVKSSKRKGGKIEGNSGIDTTTSFATSHPVNTKAKSSGEKEIEEGERMSFWWDTMTHNQRKAVVFVFLPFIFLYIILKRG